MTDRKPSSALRLPSSRGKVGIAAVFVVFVGFPFVALLSAAGSGAGPSPTDLRPVSLPVRGPALVTVAAVLAWILAMAVLTPWRAELPHATADDVARWPEVPDDIKAARRHGRLALVANSALAVVVVLLAMSGPGSRLLEREAPDIGSARAALTVAGFALIMQVVRIPAFLVLFTSARTATRDPALTTSWWVKRALLPRLWLVLIAAYIGPDAVRGLRDHADTAWKTVLIFYGVVGVGVGTLVAAAFSGGSFRNARPPGAGFGAAIARVLPRVPLKRSPAIVVAERRGPDIGGAAWGVFKPHVAISPQWSEGLPEPAIDGLLAHELAHVSRQHPAKRIVRRAFGNLAALSGALLIVSTPVVRRAAHADGAIDVRMVPLGLAAAMLCWRVFSAAELACARREEAEADLLALRWVPPEGSRPFLSHMAAIRHPSPRWGAVELAVCATHPHWADRLGPVAPAEIVPHAAEALRAPAVQDVLPRV